MVHALSHSMVGNPRTPRKEQAIGYSMGEPIQYTTVYHVRHDTPHGLTHGRPHRFTVDIDPMAGMSYRASRGAQIVVANLMRCRMGLTMVHSVGCAVIVLLTRWDTRRFIP